MSFVSRAQDFLKDQGDLKKHPKHEIMMATIQFLFDEDAIGRQNLVSTNSIIEHLNAIGHKIERGPWETDVLGPLRDSEIWLGSKPGGTGGIFIIKDKNDFEVVKKGYSKKYQTMMRRYQILERLGEEL